MRRDSCPDLEQLSPFVDGELPTAESRSIRRHAAGCLHCARRIEEIRGLDALLGDAVDARPPTRVLSIGLVGALAASLLVAVWLSRPASDPTVPTPPEPAAARTAEGPAPAPGLAERVAAIVRAEADGADSTAEDLRALGLAARHHLVARIGDVDDDVAAAALRLAADLGERRATPAAIRALGRPTLAYEAARTLGALRARGGLPALENAYRHDGPAEATAAAIASIGGRAGLAVLAGLVENEEDPDRRAVLLRASRHLGASEAAALLATHVDDPSAREILLAQANRIVPALRTRLGGPDAGLAARALAVAGDRSSVRRIARLLRRHATREDAARALADLGGDDALAALFEATDGREGDPAARALAGMGEEATDLLVSRFDHGDHGERLAAVRILGLRRDAATLEVLVRASNEPSLADDAVAGLGRLGRTNVAAVDVLARLGESPALRPAVIRALGVTGRAEAVPALRALAMDLTSTRQALAALGRIPGEDAIGALLGLMDRPRCAEAARRALDHHDPDLVTSVRERRDASATIAAARRPRTPNV